MAPVAREHGRRLEPLAPLGRRASVCTTATTRSTTIARRADLGGELGEGEAPTSGDRVAVRAERVPLAGELVATQHATIGELAHGARVAGDVPAPVALVARRALPAARTRDGPRAVSTRPIHVSRATSHVRRTGPTTRPGPTPRRAALRALAAAPQSSAASSVARVAGMDRDCSEQAHVRHRAPPALILPWTTDTNRGPERHPERVRRLAAARR